MNPTYQSGFYAPGRGTALHPELWRGCVGAWNPGLGNTGLVLRDWSGNQNNGTLANGLSWGVSDGRQALSFNAANKYIEIPPITLADDKGWAITTWIIPASFANFYGLWGDLFTPGNYSRLLLDDAGRVKYLFNPANTLSQPNAGPLIANIRQHACIVGTSQNTNNILVYIDGKLKTTSTLADNTQVVRRLGNYGDITTGSFRGFMDEFRIYNRALSPNEIRTLATRPGIAYELARRKAYLPAEPSLGNPTGILQNNLQSIRLGL